MFLLSCIGYIIVGCIIKYASVGWKLWLIEDTSIRSVLVDKQDILNKSLILIFVLILAQVVYAHKKNQVPLKRSWFLLIPAVYFLFAGIFTQ